MSVALLAACATPKASPAGRVYRVGWFSAMSAQSSPLTDALRASLHDLGYVDGQNLILEPRYAAGDPSRYAPIAAEFVAQKVDVVVSRDLHFVLAMKAATSAIPIVMMGSSQDPVADGLVASLAHPGGNVTGTMSAGALISQRRIQLLKETISSAARIAYFIDLGTPNALRGYENARPAAESLGIELQPIRVSATDDVHGALAAAESAKPDAVLVGEGGILAGQQAAILDWLAARRLPSMTLVTRSWIDRGALLYYDENQTDLIDHAAAYIDRILKGVNPGDIPIQVASKFDFIVNTKTAKALGIAIPSSVLAQATEQLQ